MQKLDLTAIYSELVKRLIEKFCATGTPYAQQFLINVLQLMKRNEAAPGWSSYAKSFIFTPVCKPTADCVQDLLRQLEKIKFSDDNIYVQNQQAFAAMLQFFELHKARNTIPKVILPNLLHKLIVEFVEADNLHVLKEEINLLQILQDEWQEWDKKQQQLEQEVLAQKNAAYSADMKHHEDVLADSDGELEIGAAAAVSTEPWPLPAVSPMKQSNAMWGYGALFLAMNDGPSPGFFGFFVAVDNNNADDQENGTDLPSNAFKLD